MGKERSADLSLKTPLAAVYLLYGTQNYLIRQMQNNIVRKALTPDEESYNLTRYNLTEVPVQTALEDAETIPFLGEKKVVVLENPFFLTAEKVKAKIDQNWQSVEQYLENPAPQTVLILTAPYEKLDRRKKLVKRLLAGAEVHELSILSDSVIYRLMEQVAAAFGARYTHEAHEQLLAFVGTNLDQLAHEVGKCALYCGKEHPMDRQAVLTIGSRSLETNVFLLVNQVMKKNTAESLRLLHELVRMKEEPLKILALLERQFRIVYQVAVYGQAGYTQGSIAAKIGAHPYAVKMAAEQARGYAPEIMAMALRKCAETDYQIKTGRLDKTLALELLIHRTAASGTVPERAGQL